MKKSTILDVPMSPFKQVGIVLIFTLVFMLISGISPDVPYSKTTHIKPWIILCTMILFYALINSILSFSVKDHNKYWLHSMISFAILLVFGGCMAWLISGVSIDDAASVKWLYVVFTIGYIVFLTIVNLIKFFVKFSKNYKNNH